MLTPHGPTARVRVLRLREGSARERRDVVAVEEPLEVRIRAAGEGKSAAVHPVAVTMRTPGDDFDLAAGFLFGEGILVRRDQVAAISHCGAASGTGEDRYNVVEVRLRPGVSFDPDRIRRNFYVSSSCGVCGKASLEAVAVRTPGRNGPDAEGGPHGRDVPTARSGEDLRVDASILRALPDTLRGGQRVFDRTGGLHAAALVDPAGTPRALREDVGRHNAVDKVVGAAFLAGELPLDRSVLVVSGRTSFEILQKAVAVGVPVVVAVGAPSSLAIDLAERFGVTLVGFAGSDGFNVYAHPHRVEGLGPGPEGGTGTLEPPGRSR